MVFDVEFDVSGILCFIVFILVKNSDWVSKRVKVKFMWILCFLVESVLKEKELRLSLK